MFIYKIIKLKIKSYKRRRGFTLLELLLYSAILATMTGFIGTMVYVTTQSSLKANVEEELNHEMSFLEETLRQKISNSKGINSISGSSLSLEMADNNKNPAQFSLSNNVMYLQEGSGDKLALNDVNKVKVTSLTFSPTGPENLGIASTDHYAWNDQIGWIDFAYPGGNIQAPAGAGDFTGLAYVLSDGHWISLNCLSTDSCSTVNYKVSSDAYGNLSGWAWDEEYGWISFNCSNDDSCTNSNYKVTMNPNTGEFDGYAYSENIGWISFNCDTGGDNQTNICSTSNYKVQNLRLRTTAIKVKITLRYNSPKSVLAISRSRTFVFNILTPSK